MNPRAPVLIAGASGLVGGHVLTRLLWPATGPRVLAPVRRPLGVEHARLAPLLGDPAAGTDDEFASRLAAIEPRIGAFVCCLGTTLRDAGSREAFVAVDRELVLRLARISRTLGAGHAVLVSSVGASAQSGNFYLRVKGEVERALASLGFARVDVLRPGLLLGDRAQHRPGERIARAFAPAFNPLLRGRLSRYRAIPADSVAAAAVALLDQDSEGVVVHEHASLSGRAAIAG